MKFIDFEEVDYPDGYKNPVEGKTYISPPLKIDKDFDNRTIRIVTRGIDSTESYEMVKIKDEVLLRRTDGGKYIISAKIIESDNHLFILKINKYTAATDNPHKVGFAFVGDEITKLYKFIKDVQLMQFGSAKFQKLSDDDIKYITFTDEQAAKLFLENKKLFSDIVRSEITDADIISIGYRKKQVEIFEKLLYNSTYFNDIKDKKKCTTEQLWQTFFEKNQWIFGYGLGYVFLTGLDDKKLEQVVQGHNVNSYGKRVDALMKTRGIISNLCFVEIKTHETNLLEDNTYRAGCFAPTKELSGAIAQTQGSVASAIKTLNDKITMIDKLGDPTGEIVYNYQPKSFLVIGNLNEFITEKGINENKLRSFELYRKNILSPEIITFDELFERAKFIVMNNEKQ